MKKEGIEVSIKSLLRQLMVVPRSLHERNDTWNEILKNPQNWNKTINPRTSKKKK